MSRIAPPGAHSPAPVSKGRVRLPHIAAAKRSGTRLTMLTAYDALTAPLLEAAGVDMLLVGDSLGNVMLGHSSTLPVTVEDMERATASVARSTSRALIVADLPFGSYEDGPAHAFASAARLMKAGANAVKLEGGTPRAASVRALTQAGIPVVGHLGFTPQSVNMLGGFRVQGRGEAADVLLADAQALAEAGAVALVLEMVPEPLAARVTESLTIPTIGIGAGARCDGQVLVWTDMAGMTDWSPRFAHQFGQVGEALRQAAADYGTAVREESFPAEKHWFSS